MTENCGWTDLLRSAEALSNSDMDTNSYSGIHPFYIEKGDNHLEAEGFEFLAPTTRRNSLRVLGLGSLKTLACKGLLQICATSIQKDHGKGINDPVISAGRISSIR